MHAPQRGLDVSDVSTVTAGAGVITWRACCS
jgi:hypothetical protein